MYYTFTFKDGNDFKVWRTEYTDMAGVIDVYDNNSRCYKRSLREDENGTFFTWNKEKFYVNDYKKITVNDLKRNLQKMSGLLMMNFVRLFRIPELIKLSL